MQNSADEASSPATLHRRDHGTAPALADRSVRLLRYDKALVGSLVFFKVLYDPATVPAVAGSTYIAEHNDTEVVYHQNLGLSNILGGEKNGIKMSQM